MKLVQNCPLCGYTHLKRLHKKTFSYPGDDVKSNLLDSGFVRRWILFNYILKKHIPVQFVVMICKNCGFIFLNPRLEDKDMNIKYDMIDQLGSVKTRLALRPPRNLDKRAANIYRRIAQYRNNRIANLQILDFGGASGYNLRPFVKDNKCYVVDYEYWNLPNGIKYLCQMEDEIPPNMKFDIVLCCHVLEHVVDPPKTVRKIGSHLVPGGLLYIEVPLGCFREFRHLRDPLTHINFFSTASLSHLVSTCGLRIKSSWVGLQWGIDNRLLCLSIIGEKKEGEILPRYASGYGATVHQMRNLLFYLLLGYNRLQSWARHFLRYLIC